MKIFAIEQYSEGVLFSLERNDAYLSCIYAFRKGGCQICSKALSNEILLLGNASLGKLWHCSLLTHKIPERGAIKKGSSSFLPLPMKTRILIDSEISFLIGSDGVENARMKIAWWTQEGKLWFRENEPTWSFLDRWGGKSWLDTMIVLRSPLAEIISFEVRGKKL